MLKYYSITDIITENPERKPYYIGTFEGTDDPDVEWPHRHDFYSLVWFTESEGCNVIDFQEYTIKHNLLFLMKPSQVHNWSYSRNASGFTLVLASHLPDKKLMPLFDTPYLDLPDTDTGKIRFLFQSIISDSASENTQNQQVALSGISYLLHQLQRINTEKKQPDKPLSQMAFAFSELVSRTVSENIPIKNYAEKLNITPEKLTEICRESYGQNPKTIVLDKKITEAKRLLYFTDLSVKEIAYLLGFEDSSYFSRIFTKKTKLSPSAFKSTR